MGKHPSEDLQCNILSFLPVKSLLRFSCVSKSWFSLIDDPLFVRAHLQRSIKTNKFIAQGTYDGRCPIFTISIDSHDHTVKDLNLPLKICNLERMFFKGSCNGLICLTDSGNNVVICNISTRVFYNVGFAPLEESITRLLRYGFGYDSINDDYKVVRIDYYYSRWIGGYVNEIRLYSLRKDSWSSPLSNPPIFFQISKILHYDSVLVSGALHWVAHWENKKDYVVVAFDISREEFGKIASPENTESEPVMGVLGGCFTLTCYDNKYVNVWVMKEYMVEESWTKLFGIMLEGLGRIIGTKRLRPITYSTNGNKILLASSFEYFFWYNPRTGQWEHFQDCNHRHVGVKTAAYSESLVSISAYRGCKETTGTIKKRKSISGCDLGNKKRDWSSI